MRANERQVRHSRVQMLSDLLLPAVRAEETIGGKVYFGSVIHQVSSKDEGLALARVLGQIRLRQARLYTAVPIPPKPSGDSKHRGRSRADRRDSIRDYSPNKHKGSTYSACIDLKIQSRRLLDGTADPNPTG
jgi:hypothetical protein